MEHHPIIPESRQTSELEDVVSGHLLVVRFMLRHLLSLSLKFLIDEMGIINYASHGFRRIQYNKFMKVILRCKALYTILTFVTLFSSYSHFNVICIRHNQRAVNNLFRYKNKYCITDLVPIFRKIKSE